jgi:branched-chain amino acid transport system permease protein
MSGEALTAAITQAILSGLTTGAIYALVGLGFCIIHNSIGIVNFTQVDFVTVGGFMMYSFFIVLGCALIGTDPVAQWLSAWGKAPQAVWAGLTLPSAVPTATGWVWPGLPFKIEPLPAVAWWMKIAALILAVAAVTVIGALVERLFIRPARSKEVVILIFITIGVSILLRGIFEIIWGKTPVRMPAFTPGNLKLLGAAYTFQDIWVLGVTLVSIAGLHWFFQKTLTGKAMRAAATTPRAATLAGVSVNRMVMLSFALAGTLGGLAGMLITPISSLEYTIGIMIGLKGFAGAVLGGYGSFIGAIVGGVVLGVLERVPMIIDVITKFLSGIDPKLADYKEVTAFVVLVLVLFVRPAGILGRGEARRV